MDDYYLPLDRRAPDWESRPGGNMDLERVLAEILLPARAHTAITCRPYSCQTGRYGGAVTVPPSPLLLVEGSYSMHPLLRDHYDLTIFTTCSARERDRRLKAREGERFPRFQALWIPLEEGYFLRDGVQAASTLVLDTTPPAP